MKNKNQDLNLCTPLFLLFVKRSLPYPVFSVNLLGDSPDILKQLADGTHPFAKRLAAAKKPVVIIGTEPLQRPDGAALMANAQKLAQDIKIKSGCGPSWRVLNVLHKVASQVCINELFCIEKIKKIQRAKMWIRLNKRP